MGISRRVVALLAWVAVAGPLQAQRSVAEQYVTALTYRVRLLRRADAQPVLQAHLLNGRAATPLVVIYDDVFVERGVWIERPAALRAFIAANSSKLDDDALARAIRGWRANDAGRSVLDEVLSQLERPAGRSRYRSGSFGA